MERHQKYISNLHGAINKIDYKIIQKLEDEILERISTRKNIYIIGNGGSAANAHHVAGDYLKSLSILGLRLNISCPSDNICCLTALANDVDYAQVYEIFINSVGLKDDLLITLSR